MTSFFHILFAILSCLQIVHYVSASFYRPSFDSGWFYMEAESSSSFKSVSHNLGEIPLLVDVSVKPIGGPNENFIFKGIGDSSRDDDQDTAYGGVVYIYGNTTVDLYLPKRHNGNANEGKGINTGASPHWTGVNIQQDREVMVRVRCWIAAVLPEPCFKKTGIHLRAGSTHESETFNEVTTNIKMLPQLVKVRAKLEDNFVGWYTDAQGSSQASLDVLQDYWITGGMISAFDENRIRVWTSSNSPFGKLFGVDDGWGVTGTHYGQARSGLVEMYAWCSIGKIRYKKAFRIGAGVNSEALEQPLAVPLVEWAQDGFLSVTVKVIDGDNKGFYFDGIGAATHLVTNLGQRCSYGGLVYGYSDTLLRVWRPDTDQGAIVCIPEKFGTGKHVQAAKNVDVHIAVWNIDTLKSATQPADVAGCGQFWLHAEGIAYLSSGAPGTEVYENVTSIQECIQICLLHGNCVSFSYSYDYGCILMDSSVGMVTESMTSQIWTRVNLELTSYSTTSSVTTTNGR